MKYVRLLRLQDQYIILSVVVASGLYFHVFDWRLLFWAIATTSISVATFIVNELIDRNDTDAYSWNSVHIKKSDRFHPTTTILLIAAFSLLGFFAAIIDGLFWWSVLLYLIGMAYSLPPLRLKARFGFDIAAQLLCWLVIPFLALGWEHGNIVGIGPIVIPMICFAWAIIFPYQLADFSADKKAHLENTHIILGMRNSLSFGLATSTLGIVTFFVFHLYSVIPWAFFFLAINLYVSARYIRWLHVSSEQKLRTSLQEYVKIAKPLGYLAVPYLLLWMK